LSKRKPLLALFVFISLLFGCNDETENFTMLTSEKTLPTNFEDIAFKQGTDTLLVRKAADQAEFDATWSLYGLETEMPEVDFNENVVFFIGVYESGSCPLEIRRVELNADHTTMTIPLSMPKELSGKIVACTSNATPRTFVIQLEKELTENLDDLVIDETNVPFEY
jgi:hypothetical protein